MLNNLSEKDDYKFGLQHRKLFDKPACAADRFGFLAVGFSRDLAMCLTVKGWKSIQFIGVNNIEKIALFNLFQNQ